MYEIASSFDPLQSTYLDLRLCDVLRKVGDDDLAVSRSLAGECARGNGCSGLCLVLLDATGWCSDGGLRLGFGAAGGAWAATASGWLAAIMHDLVERLVELSRHGGEMWCAVDRWCRLGERE